MSTPVHGDPTIDKEVAKVLTELKKLTVNQKYLANCSKSLCKSVRTTAHKLSGIAADFYDSRVDQKSSGHDTAMKKLAERVGSLEKATGQIVTPIKIKVNTAKALKPTGKIVKPAKVAAK